MTEPFDQRSTPQALLALTPAVCGCQLLRQTVRRAGTCETGAMRPGGQRCAPEGYIRRIRRIRRMLSEAGMKPPLGQWVPMLRADPEHRAVRALRAMGLKPKGEMWLGLELAVVNVPEEHLAAYCRLLDTHVDELPAWRWFKVEGLPPS